MEIEFNPGRNAMPGASHSVTRRTPAQSTGETAHFDHTRALEQKLSESLTVRPEKVARGRALVSDAKYPPQELMDRIANLLAMKMKKQ